MIVSDDVSSETRKQATRENVPSSIAEEYFIRMIFIPTINDFISELQLMLNSDFYGIFTSGGPYTIGECNPQRQYYYLYGFEVQHVFQKFGVSINPLRTTVTRTCQLLGAFSPDCHKYLTALVDFSQRMYSVKKGHFHTRNVNQRPQRYLVPGEEYVRQEKQLPDVLCFSYRL
ncbi:hypothetical protein AVEN_201214-1 [Araneus ventricosus]|uniref:Uncharacterized protein n=1 Tax=Araneus ventricosus TaxID=182803 RepID=A0A4Y2HPT2_ARAVE|nr:hypothetical protein AVEN_201214-1 [Araneus ventricosus]